MTGINITQLQDQFCTLLCTEIKVHKKTDSLLLIETPFSFPDGDPYQIYLKEKPGGILCLSDMGHTFMQLSYENDLDALREGTRGRIYDQIKAETSVSESDGELFIDTNLQNLGLNLFRFSQALTKVNDLTYLNRFRVESTFYEDFRQQLFSIVDEELITADYLVPEIQNAADYPIDYKIKAKDAPLFVFGVPNRDKARLTTIILERLLRTSLKYDTLIVFADQTTIPKGDISRLMNVGNEMISSLNSEEALSRKILRKLNPN